MTKPLIFAIAVSCLSSIGGCKHDLLTGEQKLSEAMRIACNALEQDEVKQAAPDSKIGVVTKYIADNVTNKEAIELFSQVDGSKTDREKRFRELADKAGIKNCPLLDSPPWNQQGPQ